VLGTHTLLEAVRELDLPRYLQIGTDEVYGSIDSGSFTEDSPLRPSSPYSASKAGADMVVMSYVTTYGTPALITRSSNNYGPWQYPEKIIPLFVSNAIDGLPLPVYGDGMNVRDWLYVEDNCAGIDLVLRKGEPGQAYNIGGEHEVPNIELTREILRLVGKDESLIRWVADRPGHDRRYSVDCSKLKALGWAPQAAFDEGLARTVDWYRTHEDWWRPIKSGEYREYYERQYQGLA
jgi:dTDP-glucose 4,6-dehydratase